MKWLPLLLVALLVPVLAWPAKLPSSLLPAVEMPMIPSVKLTNGRTLKQVIIISTTHDTVTVQCSEGLVTVPFSVLPDSLLVELQNIRPKDDLKIKVRGALTVTPAEPADPNAKAGSLVPKQIYTGRVALADGSKLGKPLEKVQVLAVRLSDFAKYDVERLKLHGAEIDQAVEKMKNSPAGAARDAAQAEAMLAVFNSIDPPPPYVATDLTEANGRFTLTCDVPPGTDIVLVARTQTTMGKSPVSLVWVGVAQAGQPAMLDNNVLLYR